MSPSKRFAIAAAIVAAAAIAMLPLSAYADKAEGSNVNESQPFTSSVSQIGESTAISIAIDSASTLVDNGIADTISVNAAMTYNDAITRSVSSEAALNTLASNEFQVDLQDYGPFFCDRCVSEKRANGQQLNLFHRHFRKRIQSRTAERLLPGSSLLPFLLGYQHL